MTGHIHILESCREFVEAPIDVIPSEEGIQDSWIPAFTGMTDNIMTTTRVYFPERLQSISPTEHLKIELIFAGLLRECTHRPRISFKKQLLPVVCGGIFNP